jgi:hypothetical protein
MLALAPAALFLSIAQGAAPPAAAPPIVVTAARFYAIDNRNDPPAIVESTTIPYRPETSCFGWVLEYQRGKGEATIREELRLPAPAPNWGAAEDTTVHPDRAGATTLHRVDLSEGAISSEWCLSEGDPTGAHRISVYSGDRLLHRFDFTVVPPPRAI